MNEDYGFWKMAYDMKAIDIDLLKQAVKCDSNIHGEISKEEFKEITGEDFN